ncbi:MAG: hypothetical protein ACRCZI_10785 [Cetobacterium sp.]
MEAVVVAAAVEGVAAVLELGWGLNRGGSIGCLIDMIYCSHILRDLHTHSSFIIFILFFMTAFGIPNGDLSGMDQDFLDEPDVQDGSPFEDGVEHGKLDEGVIRSSSSSPTFHVEDAVEPVEEAIVNSYRVSGDFDAYLPLNEVGIVNVDELDDSVVVTGDVSYGDDGVGSYTLDESKEDLPLKEVGGLFTYDDEYVSDFDYDSDQNHNRDDDDDGSDLDDLFVSE